MTTNEKQNKQPEAGKKELTPRQIQMRKKMVVFPLFFLAFAGCMWLIFSPGEKEREEPSAGFNTELPTPESEGILSDKRDAYVQEEMRRREREKMRSLQDFAFGMEDEEEEPVMPAAVPVELRTEAVCLRAVSGDGILLHEVPEELRTERVCEAAVSSNYLALEYVPKHLKTDRLCGMALERDPLAIRFFNPEQLTPEVCNRALARTDDLRVLRYIPFEEIHLKVLGFYCTNYDKTFDFLENMNPWFLTPRVAREIFALEPELFYNLPDHAKNEEMCRRAVWHDGSYLQYVPEKWKTPELCMEAIRRSPYAIAHLPESMKSPDLYMSLVRENPQNLKGVPREARTPEMSREAFERTYGKDKTDFSVISALSDPALVLQVFREQDDPQQIHRLMSVLHLNRRLVTEEVALEAVRKDAGVLYDIPQRAITPLVADTAVRGDPRMIQWVPRELRTADLCLYAEAAHPELRVYVPDEIAKGRNIYSFHRQVDAKLRQPLEYEQYKTLYSGGAVRVNNVWTSVAGEIDCCEVRYDRKTEKLKLRIVEPPREKKAQPKVAPRKPARGPKL